VGRFGALDQRHQLEIGGAGGKLVEEALAAAEQDRDLVDEDLVEVAGGEALVQRRGATADGDVAIAGERLRP